MTVNHEQFQQILGGIKVGFGLQAAGLRMLARSLASGGTAADRLDRASLAESRLSFAELEAEGRELDDVLRRGDLSQDDLARTRLRHAKIILCHVDNLLRLWAPPGAGSTQPALPARTIKLREALPARPARTDEGLTAAEAGPAPATFTHPPDVARLFELLRQFPLRPIESLAALNAACDLDDSFAAAKEFRGPEAAYYCLVAWIVHAWLETPGHVEQLDRWIAESEAAQEPALEAAKPPSRNDVSPRPKARPRSTGELENKQSTPRAGRRRAKV